MNVQERVGSIKVIVPFATITGSAGVGPSPPPALVSNNSAHVVVTFISSTNTLPGVLVLLRKLREAIYDMSSLAFAFVWSQDMVGVVVVLVGSIYNLTTSFFASATNSYSNTTK